MKRVVVTTSYPRGPDDPSGCFVRAEALEAHRRGEEVVVLAPGPALPEEGPRVRAVGGADAFGWPGVWARVRARPWRIGGWGAFVAGARRALEEEAPDRVECHWLLPCLWPVATTGPTSFDGPVEAVAHGADVRLLSRLPLPLREALVARWLDRPVALRFVATAILEDAAGHLSPPLAARLRQVASVRPAALGDLGPRAEAHAVRTRWSLDPTQPWLVVVSRLLAGKRVEGAIEVARRLDLPLVVVGDGPEEARLRARAEGAPVRFAGRLGRAATLDAIAAADILLHPSSVDAAPTVVREARALGTVVVSHGAGDVARWAREDPGIVVAEDLSEAVAARLRPLL